MSEKPYSNVILDHYRGEVEAHGLAASSTMQDDVTRNREIEAIRTALHYVISAKPIRDVLEIGSGNGYLLELLRRQFATIELTAVEYTPEMVALARSRELANCNVVQGDVRALAASDASFDVVISERCIVNVMNQDDQAQSLREVARVLRPGGYFVCVEAFMDGLQELNTARDELGLPPNVQPHHNLWFEKAWFFETIKPLFRIVNDETSELPQPNFLSSHYFISRVLYPTVTKREVLYNTHLVKFFRFLPPMGNYAPIQIYVLQRLA
jgi:ubiquinone/menaquinone biosynthesis C-methylase UbiE